MVGSLTPSELTILELIAQDKTSKEISKELFIALSTVDNHRANICKKLNVSGNYGILKFVLLNQNLFTRNY